MSRRRRGRAVPPTDAAVVPSAQGTIRVNIAKLEIPDLRILARFRQLDGASPEEQFDVIVEALPMLERVVVGGLAGRPIEQLGAIMEAVTRAMNARSNPGNSGRG